MNNLNNTYCDNNEKNLSRYITNGFVHVSKLDEGSDFIVGKTVLGRDICHTVSNNYSGLQHYKFIEDVEEYTKDYLGVIGNRGPGPGPNGICVTDKDLNSTSGLSVDTSFVFPVGLTTSGVIDVNNHEKQYGESKVLAMLEHILSFQKNLIGGNWINVDDVIREVNKFGFYPNSHGRKIDE